VTDVARDLGIGVNMLHRWKRKLEENREGAFQGSWARRRKPYDVLRRNWRRRERSEIFQKKSVGLENNIFSW